MHFAIPYHFISSNFHERNHLGEKNVFNQDIPTLFISASPPSGGLERRHVSFLPKPFGVDEFVQQVNTLLSRR